MKAKSDNYLDYIYEHESSLSWNDKDGKVTLAMENKGIFNRVLQLVMKKPRVSYIDLDEFGSFVWLHIDGSKTVGELGREVGEHFGDRAEPLYERLSVFMKQLEGCGFVRRFN